jgi:hypothetical protein
MTLGVGYTRSRPPATIGGASAASRVSNAGPSAVADLGLGAFLSGARAFMMYNRPVQEDPTDEDGECR